MGVFWVSFFAVGFILATLMYTVARKHRLMAIVDTIWTAGLGLAACSYFLLSGLDSLRAWLVLLVVSVWSFRLSFYLFRDRVLKGQEDPRYLALAEYWGEAALRNFYFLFLVQIPCIALFLCPVVVAMENSSSGWFWSDTFAVMIALVALSGEAISDRQLAVFRGNPKNKGAVCRVGLWRFSRHPNYFFEWLHWFAYVAFAYSSTHGWIALIGPISMYVFLRFITGVPHSERSSLKRRGDAYRIYQKTTNAFFPWIPTRQTD